MAPWLDTLPQLEEFVARIGEAKRLALDTEFLRERTYWPQLALVQMTAAGQMALVDPLAVREAAPWRQLLAAPRLCLMHAPGEDLECLRHHYGVLPERLFDTQLAAAFAGAGHGLGYQALVAQLLGIQLDKGETRSDWMQRPLSAAQCAYAAADVIHLDALADMLLERIEQRGRREWFEADCARMLAAAAQPGEDPWPHLGMRVSARLPAIAQARLCVILRWREQEARRADRPRGWVLDNETSVRLAEAPPGVRSVHEQIFANARSAARRAREALWELLAEPPADLPLARVLSDAERRIVTRLQQEVARCAAEVELPEALLLARRQIEHLVQTGHWPSSHQGWRQALLEPRLRALINAPASSQ